MNACDQLWELYQEWKRLTQQEGAAIVASNWPEVRRCQQAKRKLQPEIIRSTDAANSESSSAGEQLQANTRIREIINELILHETKNSSTLRESVAIAEEERSQLDRTSENLRKVHRTYLPAQDPGWGHYS